MRVACLENDAMFSDDESDNISETDESELGPDESYDNKNDNKVSENMFIKKESPKKTNTQKYLIYF